MVTYDVFIDPSHAAMPSNQYEDLSNDSIAPADGWVLAVCSATNVGTIAARFFSLRVGSLYKTTYAYVSHGVDVNIVLPASKGDQITMSSFSLVNASLLRFYYGNGSVPANP